MSKLSDIGTAGMLVDWRYTHGQTTERKSIPVKPVFEGEEGLRIKFHQDGDSGEIYVENDGGNLNLYVTVPNTHEPLCLLTIEKDTVHVQSTRINGDRTVFGA